MNKIPMIVVHDIYTKYYFRDSGNFNFQFTLCEYFGDTKDYVYEEKHTGLKVDTRCMHGTCEAFLKWTDRRLRHAELVKIELYYDGKVVYSACAKFLGKPKEGALDA